MILPTISILAKEKNHIMKASSILKKLQATHTHSYMQSHTAVGMTADASNRQLV